MDINPNQVKVRCIKPNGQVVMLSKATARDTAFLKKYGIRIEDEAYLNPQSQVAEQVLEAPKRRRVIQAEEPQVIVSQSAETMMEQTPEVPQEEEAEEPLAQEIPTEETPTIKTRRK